MKSTWTLTLALILAPCAAQADEGYVTPNGTGLGCAGGYGGAEAWLVPRPGPQGFSHPATNVYAERCCRDHYPGCCDHVWDGYCSERYCWHADKSCQYGTAGCYGCTQGYTYGGGPRWSAYRGWSGGGWGWNPGASESPTLAQPAAGWHGPATATWSGTAASGPASAPAGAVRSTAAPSFTPQGSSATGTVAPAAGAEGEPSARNWSGYPRMSSRVR